MRNQTAILCATLLVAAVSTTAAQDIAGRVQQTRNGVVRLTFASRPGVCGDGATFISERGRSDIGGERTIYRSTRDGYNITTGDSFNRNWQDCVEGPLRVELNVENGAVNDVQTYVGGNWRGEQGLTVSSRAAVPYLLHLAERGSARLGRHAMVAVILADSVDVAEGLLRLARNNSVATETRKSATFWLGQAAGERATQGLRELVRDDNTEVRKSAVFALSQMNSDKSLEALIDLARNSKDREVRKSALFWLSQKNDPRVLALYEEILLRN